MKHLHEQPLVHSRLSHAPSNHSHLLLALFISQLSNPSNKYANLFAAVSFPIVFCGLEELGQESFGPQSALFSKPAQWCLAQNSTPHLF
jgi:hypothetical protein